MAINKNTYVCIIIRSLRSTEIGWGTSIATLGNSFIFKSIRRHHIPDIRKTVTPQIYPNLLK